MRRCLLNRSGIGNGCYLSRLKKSSTTATIECKVVDIKPLGSHDMFLAEVVNVLVDAKYIDENDKLDMAAMDLIAYTHGEYFDVSNPKGFFGWSVRRKKSNQAREEVVYFGHKSIVSLCHFLWGKLEGYNLQNYASAGLSV